MKLIQAYEHQLIRVGDFPGFEQSHYEALCSFYERQPHKFYSLAHKGIRLSHYVGVLQVGALTIEILPKAGASLPSDGKDWQRALMEMLRVCRLLKVESISSADLSIRPHAILDLYFEIFISEVETLIRQGLIRHYHRSRGPLNRLKGRILMQEQLRQQVAKASVFITEHDAYDYAHLYNCLIKKGLKLLRQLPLKSSLAVRLQQLINAYPGVPDISVQQLPDFNTLTFDRKTARYQSAVEIALLLLKNHHPGLNAGAHHTLALLFDMNLLFEEYLYRCLLPHQQQGLTLARQQSRPFWGRRYIRPDIVLDREGERLVIDTKWKAHRNQGPTMNDLRQILAYARQFGASRGVIVYPRIRIDEKSYARPFAQPASRTEKMDCQVAFVDLLRDGKINPQIGAELLASMTADLR
jgi:5-methylcytosine-specific restriction enzyme subunit McrC